MTPFERFPRTDDPAVRERLARNRDLLARTPADDAAERLRLLGAIGNDERALGDLDHAEQDLAEAVALARFLGDVRREAANLIRLATAIQHAERHAEAEPLFRAALALTEREAAAMYRDFALQHWAKWLVETGNVPEAVACFEQALAIRRAKGDGELIASTERSLAAARELLSGVAG
jgi:tetratricopeptide (TPR) repeat protein